MDDKKTEYNQQNMTDSIYCTIRTAYAEGHINLENLKTLKDLIKDLYNRKKEEMNSGKQEG